MDKLLEFLKKNAGIVDDLPKYIAGLLTLLATLDEFTVKLGLILIAVSQFINAVNDPLRKLLEDLQNLEPDTIKDLTIFRTAQSVVTERNSLKRALIGSASVAGVIALSIGLAGPFVISMGVLASVLLIMYFS